MGLTGVSSSHSPQQTLAIASSLVSTLAILALVYRNRQAFSSASSTTENQDSDGAETSSPSSEDGNAKYIEKREFYSQSTGNWEAREKDDDEGEAKKHLFTVKHRVWPKSAEFVGHEDHTLIELHSEPLIQSVRLKLKEVEEAFEDQPAIDSKDIFLHLEDLKTFVEETKVKIEELKKKEAEAEGGATEGEAPKEGSEPEKKEEGEKEKEKVTGESSVEEEVKTDEEKSAEEPSSAAEDDKKETVVATPQTGPESKSSEDEVPAKEEKEEKEEKEKEKDGKDDADDEDLGFVPEEEKTSAQLAEQVEHLATLLTFIEELFAPIQAKLDRLLVDSLVSFQLLWAIFKPGPEAYVESTDDVCGERFAFKLKSCTYILTRDGLVFSVSGTKLVWTGTRYVRTWVECQIPKFKGMRKISSLPVHPLSDKHREELTARGLLYTGLARVAFMTYSGSLIQVVGSGIDRRIIKLRAEGRAVVDVRGYKRMNPSRTNAWEDEDDDDDYPYDGGAFNRPANNNTVAENELCLLPPTVFGFSLVQREWGEMRVDQFDPVVFNDNAYDYLVIDPDQKDLIKSLVEQNSKAALQRASENDGQPEAAHLSTKNDFIGGKGGGLVVALHGRPGTGKTLTAEAIAELLHVPLYAVGAGELGVHADALEKRLRDTLDVAGTWGAVLLIDEADVFLEERSMHDVARNAMVSVFLRLLEYHSGILILTTNRIRTVDSAFLSRFSLAITYPDLSVAKRRQIWTTFLTRAGAKIEEKKSAVKKVNGILPPTPASSGQTTPVEEVVDEKPVLISAKYLDKLANKQFNGRSIKNTVRTASALAASKGIPLAEHHLETVVRASETFLADIKEPDEDSVYDAHGEGWKSRTNVYS
ncbi:P-loop containing nucleoside triphosphate hydrolase protein [Meredithblackwellia eburnea MCA 4105]